MAFTESLFAYGTAAGAAVVSIFTSMGSFLSPVPLLVALLIAGLVVARRQRKRTGDVTLAGLVRELAPAETLKHASARHDIWIILINHGLLFFLPILAAIVVGPIRSAVIELTGAAPALSQPPAAGMAHMIAFGIYYALVWDFFVSYTHYLKHKIPVLWEFHKVHHCAEVLTPLTAMRRHPVEIVVSGMITGAGIALSILLWVLVIGAPGTAHTIGGVAIIIYAWRLLGYNIRHSHVWISYGPFWNQIFISPAHHQLHHSREPRHHDCNFGHIFAFWDRLFGTLYHPQENEKIEFGIEHEENEKLNTLSALYFRPMRKAAERFWPGTPERQSPTVE